jgi:hypothetical protein
MTEPRLYFGLAATGNSSPTPSAGLTMKLPPVHFQKQHSLPTAACRRGWPCEKITDPSGNAIGRPARIGSEVMLATPRCEKLGQ